MKGEGIPNGLIYVFSKIQQSNKDLHEYESSAFSDDFKYLSGVKM